MKKLLSIILVVLLATTFACGGGDDTSTSGGKEKKVTITYWAQASMPYPLVNEKLIEEFEAAYPNIKVEFETFPEYRTKTNTAFSTNTTPDVLQLYGGTMNHAKGGKVAAVPESIMSKAEIESIYYPASLANRLYDGAYYGLPIEINMEAPGLIVNNELVQAQGLEIPSAWIENNGPATWDELYEFARKLTIIEGGVMKQAGLGVHTGTESATFLSLIWQYGGDYRDPTNMKVDFTIPEAKQAAEFLLSLVDGDGLVHDKSFVGRLDGFNQTVVAMSIAAPWYAPAVEDSLGGDLDYQYFNLPPYVDGSDPYYVAEGGWGYVVSANSKQQESAWKFVKFMSDKANTEYFTGAVGAVPARKDTDVPDYDPSKGSVEKALAISQEVVEFGRDPGAYTMDTSQLIWTIVRQNLRPMMQGDLTVDEALTNMTNQGNKMIQDYLNRE